MGIKNRVSEIRSLIIYYLIVINACCDISVINCDIHEMRQKHVEALGARETSEPISPESLAFKINATELEEHIMSGLNMTEKPDIDLVSRSKRLVLSVNGTQQNFFN